MQKIGITQISDKESEIADGLQKLGLSRISALALAGIRSLGTAKTRDIEKIAGLRQPEVSIGIRGLMEHGWVSEKEEKKIGKGRPNKVYTLKVGFNIVLTDLERAIKDKENRTADSIKKLRALAKKR